MNHHTIQFDPEQIHRMKLAFQQALAYAEQLQSMAIQESVQRVDDRGAPTQFDIVSEVLTHANDEGLTVSEIAEASGISPASVRMVLYSNKDEFKAERLSPRRIRWQLNEDTDSSHTVCDEAEEMIGV